MEPITKSKGKTSTKSPIPLSTPIKTLNPNTPSSISDQIPTPEKPIQLPPRTRNRSVALSIKEVKKIAQGLQRTNQSISKSERLDRLRSNDDDLLSAEISRPTRAKPPIKLMEKYEILAEFFNSMSSSIRLLRLKGSPPTFPNICASIQNLTERRFTYGHLAQLKYILPEAIAIKKVLLHDQVTSCMKPDLHVSLQVDAIEDASKGKGDGGYSVLRRIFRERLADFSKRHPEGDDIPEEQLPHPFNQTKPSIALNESRHSSTYPENITSPLNALTEQEFAVPSHMPRSFKSRFSQKIPIPEAQKTPLTCYNDKSLMDNSLASVASTPIECTPKPPLRRKSFLACPILSPSSSNLRTCEDNISQKVVHTLEETPAKITTLEATPAKLTSTPARLMAATPEIQTPKRCCPPMDDNDTTPLKKSAKRSTRTKLFTTPKKNVTKVDEETEAQSSSAFDDVIGFLPEALLQSIREKERKALEEKDAGVPEAKRRQKLIACLPSTFDMILLIFQSGNRSIMTKQELIHKIIANHCKIVDRDEVEEQLKLLQELVPHWFSEKTASTGDILCSVNKLLTAEELRQKLVAVE